MRIVEATANGIPVFHNHKYDLDGYTQFCEIIPDLECVNPELFIRSEQHKKQLAEFAKSKQQWQLIKQSEQERMRSNIFSQNLNLSPSDQISNLHISKSREIHNSRGWCSEISISRRNLKEIDFGEPRVDHPSGASEILKTKLRKENHNS